MAIPTRICGFLDRAYAYTRPNEATVKISSHTCIGRAPSQLLISETTVQTDRERNSPNRQLEKYDRTILICKYFRNFEQWCSLPLGIRVEIERWIQFILEVDAYKTVQNHESTYKNLTA